MRFDFILNVPPLFHYDTNYDMAKKKWAHLNNFCGSYVCNPSSIRIKGEVGVNCDQSPVFAVGAAQSYVQCDVSLL